MAYHYQLYTFGSNGENQLGLDHPSDKVHIPTIVHNCPQEPVRSIRGGGNHTLLLTESGKIWSAGSTHKRQFSLSFPLQGLNINVPGVNTTLPRSGELVGDGNIIFCAATWESSAYVVLYGAMGNASMQEIYTEGRALHGELGRENQDITTKVSNPVTAEEKMLSHYLSSVDVRFLSKVVDFAAGMYHYVAVLEDGQVWGWGKSRNGQLGQTKERCIRTPKVIEGLPFHARRVVCGQNFTYLVGDRSTGEHMVLGDDKHGIRSKMPENVQGWKDIGASWHAIFILFEDGTLKAWGKSDLWQLVPPNLPRIDQIAVGSDHIVALTSDGSVLSWGWSTHGNCGDTTELEPNLLHRGYVTGGYNEVRGIKGEIVKIGAGYSTSFVMTRQPEEATQGTM